MTPGQKIVERAYKAFEIWCRQFDPDGNWSVEERVQKYTEWCDAGNVINLSQHSTGE